MKWNELLHSMKKGDKDAVETALTSSVPLERANGIMFAVANHMVSLGSQIEKMTSDESIIPIAHYKVGDFARAALHTLGLQRYRGDSHAVQSLMKTDFSYMLE